MNLLTKLISQLTLNSIFSIFNTDFYIRTIVNFEFFSNLIQFTCFSISIQIKLPKILYNKLNKRKDYWKSPSHVAGVVSEKEKARFGETNPYFYVSGTILKTFLFFYFWSTECLPMI